MKTKIEQVWPGWKVVRMIGAGTFGQVYEIHREEFGSLEKAALKVLTIPHESGKINEYRSMGYDNQSIMKRCADDRDNIIKEYKMMVQMKESANAVFCEDLKYVQNENGIGWDIFIKMQLLTPMMNVLGTFNEKKIIKLGMDICNALIFCKKKNIVHRDIKPQNIFVSEDGTFKLGDFGIAKTMEKTVGGTKTGTYNYMAPEVYHNKPYGSAADQYSLGLVLYWLLNNRELPFLPHTGDIPSAEELKEAGERRFNGEPLPEPVNGSEGIKQIVIKACQPLPQNRFRSPEEMREALISVLFGEPVKIDPIMPTETSAADIPEVEPIENDGNATVGVGFAGRFNMFDDDDTFTSEIPILPEENEEPAKGTLHGDETMGNSWGLAGNGDETLGVAGKGPKQRTKNNEKNSTTKPAGTTTGQTKKTAKKPVKAPKLKKEINSGNQVNSKPKKKKQKTANGEICEGKSKKNTVIDILTCIVPIGIFLFTLIAGIIGMDSTAVIASIIFMTPCVISSLGFFRKEPVKNPSLKRLIEICEPIHMGIVIIMTLTIVVLGIMFISDLVQGKITF